LNYYKFAAVSASTIFALLWGAIRARKNWRKGAPTAAAGLVLILGGSKIVEEVFRKKLFKDFKYYDWVEFPVLTVGIIWIINNFPYCVIPLFIFEWLSEPGSLREAVWSTKSILPPFATDTVKLQKDFDLWINENPDIKFTLSYLQKDIYPQILKAESTFNTKVWNLFLKLAKSNHASDNSAASNNEVNPTTDNNNITVIPSK